ncbi:DUF4062 domain-containing protein [Oenococcus oeni]|uniref:DUF4062 domain-containing protein n=1 Tax=Oenococcus oeni TaxID=1247 RepID=UPI0009B196BA|nr:DUF4062 domain-containing protein [Oenococcus oeni]
MDKIFKFFISSTFGDLKDIRNEAILGVLKAGQMPVMMEGFSVDAMQRDKSKEFINQISKYFSVSGSTSPASNKLFLSISKISSGFCIALGVY